MEIALQGLIKHRAAPVTVRTIPEKGCGVFTTGAIKKGEYLCEYKTSKVYPRELRAEREEEYVDNEESCMILEVQTPRGWFCLDATRRWTTISRLMNHTPAWEATAKPFRALKVDNTWKVAFLATWRGTDMGLRLSSPGQPLAHADPQKASNGGYAFN